MQPCQEIPGLKHPSDCGNFWGLLLSTIRDPRSTIHYPTIHTSIDARDPLSTRGPPQLPSFIGFY